MNLQTLHVPAKHLLNFSIHPSHRWVYVNRNGTETQAPILLPTCQNAQWILWAVTGLTGKVQNFTSFFNFFFYFCNSFYSLQKKKLASGGKPFAVAAVSPLDWLDFDFRKGERFVIMGRACSEHVADLLTRLSLNVSASHAVIINPHISLPADFLLALC